MENKDSLNILNIKGDYKIEFYYPCGNKIEKDIDFHRRKRNRESGYIDYSDNNKSDYYYDAIRCILFYYLKIVKNKYKNEKNEYIEEIKKLLDDIYIFKKHIFIVSVDDNYIGNDDKDILAQDLQQVLLESYDVSNRFINIINVINR